MIHKYNILFTVVEGYNYAEKYYRKYNLREYIYLSKGCGYVPWGGAILAE